MPVKKIKKDPNPVALFLKKDTEKRIRKEKGAVFRDAREKTGLTQAKLAAALKMPVATLRHWEEGRMTPPSYIQKWYLQKVNRIAKRKAAKK